MALANVGCSECGELEADECHLGEWWHRGCYLDYLRGTHDLRDSDLSSRQIDFAEVDVDWTEECDDEDGLHKAYPRKVAQT